MVTETCERCDGRQSIYDPTMADYARNGGTGRVACPRCDGKGVITRLTKAELLAEFERMLARDR